MKNNQLLDKKDSIKLKTEWKCEDCGIEYTTKKLLKLKKVKAVETDTNPKKQHGYVSVCGCGYIFHKDKWQLKNNVVFPLNWLQAVEGYISTVFLELNHFGFWYETMIFTKPYKCYYQKRYILKSEARRGHEEILRKIKNKEFEINKSEKEIIIK